MKTSTLLLIGAGGFALYKWMEKTIREVLVDISIEDIASVTPLRIRLDNPNLPPLYISASFFTVSAFIQNRWQPLAHIATDAIYLPGEGHTQITPVIIASPVIASVFVEYALAAQVAIFVEGVVSIGLLDIPVSFEKVITRDMLTT